MAKILPSLVLILSVGMLCGAGCRKKPTSAAEPPPTPAEPAVELKPATGAPLAPTGSAPTQATTLPMAFPGAGEQSPVNSPLTGAVARFHDKFRRFPRDWNELVTTGFIQTIPQPPAGKRFAIDPDTRIVVELPK